MKGTIVHVGSFRPDAPNGVHQAIAGMTAELSAAGHDVEVWHFQRSVSEPVVEQHDGVRVVRLPQTPPLAGSGALSGLLRLPTRSARAWIGDRSKDVRLFHFHSVFQPENLWLSRLGRPYVVTPHGGYSDSVLQGRNRLGKRLVMGALEGPYLRGARFIHAVSQGEASEIIRLSSPAPVVVLPNGVPLPDWPVATGSEPQTWLYIGRLAVEHKGLDLLVEGYARAIAREAGLPDLVIAGPDFRGGLATLEGMVAERGLGNRVRFPGALDNRGKQQHLGHASLFMHTSRWDGLPIAALEALAAGVPLFVTPGTNLSEPVAAYAAGFTADADPDTIATRMLDAAHADDDSRRSQRRNARALAEEQFSWPAVTQGLFAAYDRFC